MSDAAFMSNLDHPRNPNDHTAPVTGRDLKVAKRIIGKVNAFLHRHGDDVKDDVNMAYTEFLARKACGSK